MSITNEKYSYVIYMGAPVWVQPLKNTLKLVKGYDETHEGLIYTMLEGSFFLSGANFDTLISLIGTDLDFEIYENAIFDENGDFVSGTAIYQGVIGSYNDPDFNQKTIELKDFSKYYEGGAATKIILQRLKNNRIIKS